MESGGNVVAWAWSDVGEAWSKAEQARADALHGISAAAVAVGAVGRLLAGYRAKCETQAEFETLLGQCTELDAATARRCMAVNAKIATRQIDTSDHASVRQLLLDVGLMPQPEPGAPSAPQDAPWWLRITTKIDGKLARMSAAERAGLASWCRATLLRIGG